jgi:hypothetical protein
MPTIYPQSRYFSKSPSLRSCPNLCHSFCLYYQQHSLVLLDAEWSCRIIVLAGSPFHPEGNSENSSPRNFSGSELLTFGTGECFAGMREERVFYA